MLLKDEELRHFLSGQALLQGKLVRQQAKLHRVLSKIGIDQAALQQLDAAVRSDVMQDSIRELEADIAGEEEGSQTIGQSTGQSTGQVDKGWVTECLGPYSEAISAQLRAVLKAQQLINDKNTSEILSLEGRYLECREALDACAITEFG